MPYFITVLILVVVGVGFTLFQSQAVTAQNTPDSISLERVEASIQDLIATNTPAVTTDLIEEDNGADPDQELATKPSTSVTDTPKPSTPTPADTPTLPVASDFKNGSYSTQASYRTPDGTYQMDVTLTVSNDKITAANVGFDSQGARDGYSKRFSSAYKSAIIGQDLGSASLSRVGGASLTTRAFNNAVSSIRTQAS